ncbi:hypothetical protein D7W79_02260 [Corallococcus exercitus]|uniref:Uncharacterized protein n=1 Tax=Corallococcus exercitus TaxID=2316736 RepID=A0A3A8IRB8_9BACT|nr:hypothetical protein [Corallococcus exercitus]NOK34390.1 hypothetical protein [Corallococcus exercitus]RKG82504.1 hypothetical protein D7W79_02260 [Corallococcus exercitus]
MTGAPAPSAPAAGATPNAPAPELQIVGAVYGLVNVTSAVIAAVNRNTTPQSLSIDATNENFGDTWPTVTKSLTVAYRYSSTGPVSVAVVKENATLTIGAAEFEAYRARPAVDDPGPLLQVLAATYGPSDVTATVRTLVDAATQSLSLTANNATLGDTWPNVTKALVIVAGYSDYAPFIDVVQENATYFVTYRPPLRVLSAFWGLSDVTSIAQDKVRRRTLNVVANEDVFGTPEGPSAPETATLSLAYQYGDEQPKFLVVPAGDAVVVDYSYSAQRPPYRPPPDPLTLTVLGAAYGKADVTAQVRALVKANALQITPNNALFVDSWPNVPKTFAMTYAWGPDVPVGRVVEEGTQFTVSATLPAVEPSQLISLAGLFSDGDEVAVQTCTGSFWAVDTTSGQVLANALVSGPTTQFTTHPVTGNPSQMTLTDPGGTPVVLKADGTLYVAPGTPAVFVASLTTNGTAALSVVGATSMFAAVGPGKAIVAAGSDLLTLPSTFTLLMNPTQQGRESHLRALALQDKVGDFPPELWQLWPIVYDFTFGWFLALGLGPLLISQEAARTGVMSLLMENKNVRAVIEAVILIAKLNPEASITAALLSVLLVIAQEGLTWQLFRLMLDVGWFALPMVIVQLVEWFAPGGQAAKAAQIAVSFAGWAYTTTTDVLTYINSGAVPGEGGIPASVVPAPAWSGG